MSMLLALDVGNTNVTIGVFEGRRLIDYRRLRTVRDQTSDEWGILLRNLFQFSALDTAKVDGIIISSVVPPLNASLKEMAERYFRAYPVFVNSETDMGLAIRIDHPQEAGADRLVNSVAAFHRRRSGYRDYLRRDFRAGGVFGRRHRGRGWNFSRSAI
jgi:type III pantothenate kinase